MLPKLIYRGLTELSPRLALKAARLWVWKGMLAMRAYRRRTGRGELFPPFLFLAVTDACNLKCKGCWIHGAETSRKLSREQIERIIETGRRHKSSFYTLLGGEPMIYPELFDIIENHPECYFQVITNGMFHDNETVNRIAKLGNITPLVSLDGPEEVNDARRGPGVYESAMEGLKRLHRRKILFGVATTVTSANFEQVVCDEYVEKIIQEGAMYLWFYVYRPVGADPSPELAVPKEKLIELRRRMLAMRRKHPIILIDTYWDAKGRAVCPAARGLGFHIGPGGDIEPCPPLSFAAEHIDDGDLFELINGSEYLQGFQQFAEERTCGCVILETPSDLIEYAKAKGAKDSSGRNLAAELSAATPRTSHHLPGVEMPEDYWVYRFLKKKLFFGMGGYG